MSYFTKLLALLLVISPLIASADDLIKPPNGKEYKIRMIDPVVHKNSNEESIKKFFIENGDVVAKMSQNRKIEKIWFNSLIKF